MVAHKVVSHNEWVAARKKHLAKEKEFTHLRDQLSRERSDLPWELVDKDYTFEGENGKVSLQDVFEGRSQLVIYHAMFNPDTAGPHTTWTADAACFSCSWWMDNFNGITIHLNHRDITMVAVSRAQYAAIAAYKKRMGWSFPWYSSAGSDFNFDYHVSFTPEEMAEGKAEYNYRLTSDIVSRMSEAPATVQLDAQRSRCRSPLWLQLPRLHGGADGSDGAHRNVQPGLDECAGRDCLGLQGCARPNATRDGGPDRRTGRPRRPPRRRRVIQAGLRRCAAAP